VWGQLGTRDELGRWNRLHTAVLPAVQYTVPLKVLEALIYLRRREKEEEKKKRKGKSSPFTTVWSRVAPGFWSHAAASSFELEYTFGASGRSLFLGVLQEGRTRTWTRTSPLEPRRAQPSPHKVRPHFIPFLPRRRRRRSVESWSLRGKFHSMRSESWHRDQ
jgi:hypothetical protein